MRLVMMIFLILVPYGAFTVLMLVTSAAISLFVSAAVCLAVIGVDIYCGRSIKILGAGSVITFVAVGFYVTLVDPALGNSAVRFSVDTGIFLISLLSLLLRYPFTLQYALEVVDPETAKLAGFVRANYIITGAWAAAMFLMMAGNAAMIYVPGLPIWVGLLVAFAVRNATVYFTQWYPQYRRAKYGTPPSNALPGAH
jgi:hypothetical protein